MTKASFSADKLRAVGKHRKGGRMKGMRTSGCSFKRAARQHGYCQPELTTERRRVPHLSLAPYLVFAAHLPVSEHTSPGWQPLSCLPNSKMLCNRPFKCSLQNVRLSICACDGSPRQGWSQNVCILSLNWRHPKKTLKGFQIFELDCIRIQTRTGRSLRQKKRGLAGWDKGK